MVISDDNGEDEDYGDLLSSLRMMRMLMLAMNNDGDREKEK